MYTKIDVIQSICGNPTLPFKKEIRLVYNVNACVEIQKIMSRKTKLQHKKTLTLCMAYLYGWGSTVSGLQSTMRREFTFYHLVTRLPGFPGTQSSNLVSIKG